MLLLLSSPKETCQMDISDDGVFKRQGYISSLACYAHCEEDGQSIRITHYRLEVGCF